MKEQELAQKAYVEIINASDKAEVQAIYRKYILYILENYLNEKLFKRFLKQHVSMQQSLNLLHKLTIIQWLLWTY